MRKILLALIVFVFIFLVYFIFAISRKKFLEKFINGKEIGYLKARYKIKVTDKNKKQLAYIVALANSFIIALTIYIVSFLKSFWLELLVGVAILIVLILIVYHIIGKIYSKR